MVGFIDKLLTCRDCGKEFVFTAGEQQFYASKGLQHEPRRCGDCRNNRRDGNGGPAGGRTARAMHDVICNSCGRLTQVPFVPTGSRPVYCLDCFQTTRK
jgi:CxxC-x17-CxxC domain-containing protein